MIFDITTPLTERLVRAYSLWMASKYSSHPENVLPAARKYEKYINGTEQAQPVEQTKE